MMGLVILDFVGIAWSVDSWISGTIETMWPRIVIALLASGTIVLLFKVAIIGAIAKVGCSAFWSYKITTAVYGFLISGTAGEYQVIRWAAMIILTCYLTYCHFEYTEWTFFETATSDISPMELGWVSDDIMQGFKSIAHRIVMWLKRNLGEAQESIHNKQIVRKESYKKEQLDLNEKFEDIEKSYHKISKMFRKLSLTEEENSRISINARNFSSLQKKRNSERKIRTGKDLLRELIDMYSIAKLRNDLEEERLLQEEHQKHYEALKKIQDAVAQLQKCQSKDDLIHKYDKLVNYHRVETKEKLDVVLSGIDKEYHQLLEMFLKQEDEERRKKEAQKIDEALQSLRRCSSKKELKKMRKKLALQYHTDVAVESDIIIKTINNEYDILLPLMKD